MPDSTSAGITFPTSATIVCSQVFVLFGMTNPNSKKSVSTNYPWTNIFYAKLIFSTASFELNVIILDNCFALSISAGKWTSLSTPSPISFYSSPHLGASKNTYPDSLSISIWKILTTVFSYIIWWFTYLSFWVPLH